MVNLVETNMIREFKGTAIEIKRNEATKDFSASYEILIKATEHPEWELMRAWISIPKTTTNTNVPKNSALGVVISRLATWGIIAETHQETIYQMKDKTFLWKDENPKVEGKYVMKKDKLFPQAIIK